MISVADKYSTLRRASAQAVLKATPELVEILKSRKGPKGDALEVARTAGVMSAKRTWEIIPFCHPIPIEQVIVEYALHEDSVTITAEVCSIGKTGVEMEALMAAQVTAITLFDMLKPIDANMSINEVKVVKKTGGKTDFREKLSPDFKAAIIVTSDGTFNGTREDKSGLIIRENLQRLQINNIAYTILPDEQDQIRNQLLKYCEAGVDLIVTTGGTGLGPRDVTVEATSHVIEREMPAVMQAVRSFGQDRTPYAMLSRGLSGVRGKTLIINLPGSSRGVEESMNAIFPSVLHVFKMMRGESH